MRSILAFVLSLGVSLVVTWAGLHYDSELAYVGVGAILLVFVLFTWSWAFPKPVPVQYVQGPPEPEPKDDNERALRTLRRARESGVLALKNNSPGQAHTAYNQIIAALLTAKRQFGVGPLNISGEGTYRGFVNMYVHYIDEIYPLLKEGHLDEAKARAKAFTWGD